MDVKPTLDELHQVADLRAQAISSSPAHTQAGKHAIQAGAYRPIKPLPFATRLRLDPSPLPLTDDLQSRSLVSPPARKRKREREPSEAPGMERSLSDKENGPSLASMDLADAMRAWPEVAERAGWV